MIGNEGVNIPVLFTGIAEVIACLIYVVLLKKKISQNKIITVVCIATASILLYGCARKLFPVWMWPIYIMLRIVFMYLLLYFVLDEKKTVLCYYALKAFMIAEFIAAFRHDRRYCAGNEWQLVSFYNWGESELTVMDILTAIVIYVLAAVVIYLIERKWTNDPISREISRQEVVIAACVVMITFILSNISFFTANTPFSGSGIFDMFNIRTIFDLMGIIILFALQSRISEIEMKVDMAVMDSALREQYMKYRNYQDNIELVNMKYHDLKHQLEDLKNQTISDKQSILINNIESELEAYSPQFDTGNQVLDALLDSRQSICRKKQIVITAVMDGQLLDFMHVADICTIFGNALDNAIESVVASEDVQKRLIHLEVKMVRQFVCIQIENTCEGEVILEQGVPQTKKNKRNHGYGTKSIVRTVQKYNGNTLFSVEDNWFALKILIPIQKS